MFHGKSGIGAQISGVSASDEDMIVKYTELKWNWIVSNLIFFLLNQKLYRNNGEKKEKFNRKHLYVAASLDQWQA